MAGSNPVSRVELRRDVITVAAELSRSFEACTGTDVVREIADELYAWVIAPMSLSKLQFGLVTDRATGLINDPRYGARLHSPYYDSGASPMSNLQLGDSQQVTATATALDADNQPTTDTLTWTSSDTTAVSLTPSADTMSCVIDGLIPTTNVTITATDSLGNVTSGELDVVSGPATSLSLQFGPVTDRTPAASSGTPASTGTSTSTDTGATTTPDAGTTTA